MNPITNFIDRGNTKDIPITTKIMAIKLENSKKRFLFYLPLLVWTLITIFPFYYMILQATQSLEQIIEQSSPVFFQADAIKNLINNYRILMDELPYFWRNLWNSFYVSSMGTFLVLFSSSLCGYGFAMYTFKGKELLFKLAIMTLMVPVALNIIPYFAMMASWGWIDEARAVYLPGLASAYGIFLMRQYISSSVPRDLIDAARIDGCSEFFIYWRIALPLITPGLGALGIITFITIWNNFLMQLILFNSEIRFTITVALRQMLGMAKNEYGALMLGNTLSIIPITVIFIIFSKFIIANLVAGAIKN